MAYNEDSSASGHDEPWIQWFCGLKGHEMFCEVERAYIEDGFNLYGLRACVSNFSDCLDLILDRIGPDDSDDSHLTKSACTLYGLIHARYIVTAHGLDSMYNKYAAKEFGTCPLIQCSGQPVLPVGLKDDIGLERVKIFCPKCQCVYHPPPIRSRGVHHSSNGGGGAVDGAAFGTTFPHLFLMTFNNLMPDPLPPDSSYTPKVFGFRVHKSAWQQGRGGYPSRSNNNNSSRRGGAYTQRRLASMTTSRVAPAAPVQQPPASAGKDGAQDGRTGKPSANVAVAGETSPQPVEAVKPEPNETNSGVVVEEASPNGNDSTSKRKIKSDGSKNSVSPKRQKRSDAV